MATTLISGVKPVVSHAVGWVFPELQSDGRILIDRMSYLEKGPDVKWFTPTIRHGVETGEPGETVMQTLETGVPHEYAKDAGTFRWDFISRKPVIFKLVPDQDKYGLHLKVVFALKKLAGEFRDYVKEDSNPRRRTVEILGPVTMVEASELYKETVGKTSKFHLDMTVAALTSFASDRRIFERYAEMLSKFRQPEFTEEEQMALNAYPGKW